MPKKTPNTITCDPRGWWFNEGRVEDQWIGPFDTPEEAERVAIMLAPDKVETIKLLQVQAWEKREVLTKRYKKCPHCKNGFIRGRCCRTCEGTGRLEV